MDHLTSARPVVIVPISYDTHYAYIKCPHCGDVHRHWHVRAQPGGKPIGLRLSHCTDTDAATNFHRGGYFIAAIPATCTKGRSSLFSFTKAKD